MESSEQNKQNRNRLIDTENRLIAVRGEGVGGQVGSVKGLTKGKKRFLTTDNNIVITRGKGGWEVGRRG